MPRHDPAASEAIHPEACGADGELTSGQVERWRASGYAFVRGVLPAPLIDTLRRAAVATFPSPESEEAARIAHFGSGGRLTFPSPVGAFNEVTLQPRLLAAVAALLGERVRDLRLTQSDLWPKYGRSEHTGPYDIADQRIHVDYPNHTLAHPTPWSRPEAVEMILYLSESSETGGGTAVVPREGPEDPAYRWPIVDSPGIGDLRYINDRESAEAYLESERPELAPWRASLYGRARSVEFSAGDILFYRHDTWHRGTPMRPGTLRLVQNLAYRRASCEWISTVHTGWAWSAYRDDKLFERLIASSSLDQRAVLGFPQPGSPYWCAETLQAVEARYGMFGMDVAPYRAALRS